MDLNILTKKLRSRQIPLPLTPEGAERRGRWEENQGIRKQKRRNKMKTIVTIEKKKERQQEQRIGAGERRSAVQA